MNSQAYEGRITFHLWRVRSHFTGVVKDAVVEASQSDTEGYGIKRTSEEVVISLKVECVSQSQVDNL